VAVVESGLQIEDVLAYFTGSEILLGLKNYLISKALREGIVNG
jgi:hypothetical protein